MLLYLAFLKLVRVSNQNPNRVTQQGTSSDFSQSSFKAELAFRAAQLASSSRFKHSSLRAES